jgi:ADP-L-glycero-D-manno-heptose 6-epimerase
VKILVTGHKGFIGQHMISTLADKHKVDTYEWGDEYPKVKKYDWVVHLGAITSTTETDVEKIMKQNYDFSVELYKDCRHYNVNFQFASSASVYGLRNEFNEDSPVDPRTPYAWSKYMFEKYLMDHKQTARVQIFRYFNVYGPEGEDHKGDQASPYYKFKTQAETTSKIKLFKNSENYLRDFVHVSKVVDTHLSFFKVKESGIWNVGTGKPQSFLDVAKQFNVPIEEIEMPNTLTASYQKYTCADITKLTRTINEHFSD